MKIAIYGKGGIGKSTISANVSAALAEENLTVLQIGCDPKHDSTRLLLGRNIPVTVLQYIKNVLPEDRQPEDIVYMGYKDVACVEAGGPEPGVGCAGRGIITTFELLEELGIKSSFFDVTLYDVLGDVVCGGFAVPIRNEYADAIYIVTSGEYLSLYAANNILKGLRNFTEKGNRVAGIIFNARGGKDEKERVKRFADAVILPVILHIPRSPVFSRAEEEGRTLIEGYPASEEARLFRTLAGHISSISEKNSSLLHPALPLSDEELERIVLLREDTSQAEKYCRPLKWEKKERSISVSVRNKRPLIGCAFLGAVSVTTMVSDAATVMHCPRNCASRNFNRLVQMELRKAEFSGHPYKNAIGKRFITTDLTEEDFIFGGEKKLYDAIELAIHNGSRTILIITSCPAGIIGDDIEKVSSQIHESYPEIRIIPVKVDGNLVGDGVQGRMDAYLAITSLIDPDIQQTDNKRVNIIGNYSPERELNTRNMSRLMTRRQLFIRHNQKNPWTIPKLLELCGITVNCNFLNHSDIQSISQFNNASLNLPANMNDTMKSVMRTLSAVSPVPFLEQPFPSGLHETRQWLTDIARKFGEDEKALSVIAEQESEYRKNIEFIKPDLDGKTVLISTYPHDIDWLCDIATDCGMKILKIGVGYSAFSEYFETRYADAIPIVHNYTVEMRSDDIISLKPDLVLYDYPSLSPGEKVPNARIPYNPGYGFLAGVDHAEHWARLMRYTLTEGWKLDGVGVL